MQNVFKYSLVKILEFNSRSHAIYADSVTVTAVTEDLTVVGVHYF